MPHASLNVDAAGGQLIAAHQSFVKCSGHLIIVLGDPVTSHGPAPHNNPVVAGSSATVKISGIGIARQGDPASCGHACTSSSHINIGR